MEADSAIRTVVRRDDGTSYQEYVAELTHNEGQGKPDGAQRRRRDRRRVKRVTNRERVNPHDPEARITKRKDDRTRLANKTEQAEDRETGAVTVQPGAGGWAKFAREAGGGG